MDPDLVRLTGNLIALAAFIWLLMRVFGKKRNPDALDRFEADVKTLWGGFGQAYAAGLPLIALAAFYGKIDGRWAGAIPVLAVPLVIGVRLQRKRLSRAAQTTGSQERP